MSNPVSSVPCYEVKFSNASLNEPKKTRWQNIGAQVRGFIQHWLGGLLFPGRSLSQPYVDRSTGDLNPPRTWKTSILNRLGLRRERLLRIEPTEVPSLQRWNLERMTIRVDNDFIDVALAKCTDFSTKRWIIYTGGNGESMAATLPTRRHLFSLEESLKYNAKQLHEFSREWGEIQTQEFLACDVMRLADKLDSNVLFFDYPSIGKSRGQLSAEHIKRAYLGVLQYLEDEKSGPGAKEIIGYGRSLGGAIQAHALDGYTFKQGTRYAMVKDRTFGNLNETIRSLFGTAIAHLASFIGYFDYEPSAQSQRLQVPEIVVQCTKENDGMISSKCSLQEALRKTEAVGNKTFINADDAEGDFDFISHNSRLPQRVIDAIANSVLRGIKP